MNIFVPCSQGAASDMVRQGVGVIPFRLPESRDPGVILEPNQLHPVLAALDVRVSGWESTNQMGLIAATVSGADYASYYGDGNNVHAPSTGVYTESGIDPIDADEFATLIEPPEGFEVPEAEEVYDIMQDEQFPSEWGRTARMAAASDELIEEHDLWAPGIRLGAWDTDVDPYPVIRKMEDVFATEMGSQFNGPMWLSNQSDSEERDGFTVHFFSSPSDDPDVVDLPPTLYGASAPGDEAFTPMDGEGKLFLQDDMGLAQLLGEPGAWTDLYFLADILSDNPLDGNSDVFDSLASDIRSFMQLDHEHAAQDIAETWNPELRIDRIAGEFAERLYDMKDDKEAELRNEYDRQKRRMEEAQNMMRQAMKEREQISKQLIGYDDADVESFRDEAVDQLNRIFRMRKVTDVQLTPDNQKLIVHTQPLLVEDDRTGILHYLGAFKIKIPLNGRESGSGINIRAKEENLADEGYQEGMNAPHVFPDGHLCQGNFGQMAPQLFQRNQWATLVSVLIQFLESANTSDAAGKYVDTWPEATHRQMNAFEAL